MSKEWEPMDEGDVWHDTPGVTPEELEKTKREGVSLPPDFIKKYSIDGKYHRFFDANTDYYWFDENGSIIKNPDDYEISIARKTKGMPVLKKKGNDSP